MKKKMGLFTAALTVPMVLAACGDGGNEAAGGENGGGEGNNAGDNAGNNGGGSGAPDSVTIGTASQGGTYYIYGGGLASLLEQEMDITSNVEVTGGPVHNMQLVSGGELDIGMVTTGPAYEGYTGSGEWTEGNEIDDVRVVFPMYDTPFHWWSLEGSGVESIEDMAGERVGVGPAGGTSGTYLPMIHDLLELDTENVQAGASDMTSQQMDGQLDTIGFAAGIPISAVSEVETQEDITFFGIDGDMRDQVLEEYPFFDEYTIPADTYTTMDEDLETIAQFNFGIVHEDMDEDFVYEFVKAYHENNEMLQNTHSAAEEAVPDAILNNTDVPVHPGAVRYYEEEGIDIPEDLQG
ncbi:TAXI family TRAP transporter solute-binding subunit [Alkalicoccus urumqiensis]|uniref:TRAP transporter substrate-binding protein n=1 Tax=Alkalicoccus urumqiensis TaxID=1548213 RepID=A0A2P6MLQ7_ALKUR|nr:TAXI family TRAP transporter solute-binding subunit [Alkalicoccus urumqiensis]PRO67227.1 TRAP transporter substrate-binding protein [Alkalicoccus urumqiensis]